MTFAAPLYRSETSDACGIKYVGPVLLGAACCVSFFFGAVACAAAAEPPPPFSLGDDGSSSFSHLPPPPLAAACGRICRGFHPQASAARRLDRAAVEGSFGSTSDTIRQQREGVISKSHAGAGAALLSRCRTAAGDSAVRGAVVVRTAVSRRRRERLGGAPPDHAPPPQRRGERRGVAPRVGKRCARFHPTAFHATSASGGGRLRGRLEVDRARADTFGARRRTGGSTSDHGAGPRSREKAKKTRRGSERVRRGDYQTSARRDTAPSSERGVPPPAAAPAHVAAEPRCRAVAAKFKIRVDVNWEASLDGKRRPERASSIAAFAACRVRHVSPSGEAPSPRLPTALNLVHPLVSVRANRRACRQRTTHHPPSLESIITTSSFSFFISVTLLPRYSFSLLLPSCVL